MSSSNLSVGLAPFLYLILKVGNLSLRSPFTNAGYIAQGRVRKKGEREGEDDKEGERNGDGEGEDDKRREEEGGGGG